MKDGEGSESFEHAKVYLQQIKHPTFKKTTIQYQKGALENLIKYLNTALETTGIQDDTIRKFVYEELNVVLKSYRKELNFRFEVLFSRNYLGEVIFKVNEIK
ncbi:MAG: hypothetical protein HC817_11615 [Saprospiraceae bacterium]|nr:hypothetical protein [Saprospiraceae bacterium]